MRVDYLGLEAFVAIAEHGSFQRAAEVLALSQTALSHRLRKLETDLGAPVLMRSNREVALSRAGQDLLPDAKRLLKELSDSYSAVRARARQRRRQLCFACLPTVAHALLPPVLADFSTTHPIVEFTVMDIPVHQIAESVLTGASEFGVTIVSAHLPDLRVRPLFDEQYELLVHESHPLATKPEVLRADLAGQPMARIATQFKNRQLVDDSLGGARDAVDWRYVVQSGTVAMSLVSTGAAMTILPVSAATFAPPGVVRRAFADVRMTRSVGIVTRRGVPASDVAQELIETIELRLGSDVSQRAARQPG